MTEMLSGAALERARRFVDEHGRPLERARLAYALGEGPRDAVTGELAAFRAGEGGFGRALESDCRAPEASVIATLTALDILRQHDAPGDHPMVAAACAWLATQVARDGEGRLVWPFLPLSAQASPHAPWWDQSEPGQLAATFDGFVANPGVALTAHLWRHEAASPGAVESGLLDELTEQARAVVRAGLSADEVNAHDALAHFAGEEAVPDPARGEAIAYLTDVLPSRVMSRPEQFDSYGIHSLWIAPDPSHPLTAAIAEPLALALDHTIAAQEPDGSWTPFWDWAGWHPDHEAVAMTEWCGSLVVRYVDALVAHGRVERAN